MTVILDIRVLAGPNPDVAGPAVRLSVAAAWDTHEQTCDIVVQEAGAVGLGLSGDDLVVRPTDEGYVVAWPVSDRGLARAHLEAFQALLG